MSEYDPLEEVGAITAGLGLILMVVFGAIVLGLIVILMGVIIWKEGERKRELGERIGKLEVEVEGLKKRLDGGKNG